LRGLFVDLRRYIEVVDGLKELVRLDGVDLNLEMGALTEAYRNCCPACR
jgi:hypothetical protein